METSTITASVSARIAASAPPSHVSRSRRPSGRAASRRARLPGPPHQTALECGDFAHVPPQRPRRDDRPPCTTVREPGRGQDSEHDGERRPERQSHLRVAEPEIHLHDRREDRREDGQDVAVDDVEHAHEKDERSCIRNVGAGGGRS